MGELYQISFQYPSYISFKIFWRIFFFVVRKCWSNISRGTTYLLWIGWLIRTVLCNSQISICESQKILITLYFLFKKWLMKIYVFSCRQLSRKEICYWTEFRNSVVLSMYENMYSICDCVKCCIILCVIYIKMYY